ncbi:SMI1/KNR4 family protein [Chondrinema litorale]|uniref:SMI1/KNR4 family protein n=1 Tax=Chondrinema litorale TaxID=2994555 RepID=UPI0025430E83|nr:SMI1/KNR4 family protein [Chondrinema litorale]UZR99995.1 SMI1/KNR4 family protein [Chondrinema litorale]
MNYEEIKNRLVKVVDNRNYFFKNTTKQLAEQFLSRRQDFRGMSDSEISNLVSELGKNLPDDFKQYLKEFGKNCGELFCLGQDQTIEKIIEYQEWAVELFEESGIENFLGKDDLVFNFHQGYVFLFFKKEKNDYSIYEYLEGDKEPIKRFDSFNDLLIAELNHIEESNKIGQNGGGCFITVFENGITQREYPTLSSGIIPREVGDQFIMNDEI